MVILILAAGYATRLYPLTLDTPKPLLKVGKDTILGHIFKRISEIDCLAKRCFIVTNQKFFKQFKEWAAGFHCHIPIEVINDETTSNENRLGAIKDIEFVIKKKAMRDDLLVIGGDNLFEFSLKAFVGFGQGHKPAASLALFDIKDKEKARIYGVAKIDSVNRVIGFKEKPAKPESALIATCVYYFPKEKLGRISEYLSSGKTQDAPGNYIKWLMETDKVYGFVFNENWYDIGDIESLKEANKK